MNNRLDNGILFQTAVHEAGHAIMYIFLGHSFETIHIRPNESRSRLGKLEGGKPTISDDELLNFSTNELPLEERNKLRSLISNLLKIFLAGYEAERICCSSNQEIIGEFKSLDYANASRFALAISCESSEFDQMEVINRSRNDLRTILIQHQSKLKLIADELLRAKELNFDDVKHLLH